MPLPAQHPAQFIVTQGEDMANLFQAIQALKGLSWSPNQ